MRNVVIIVAVVLLAGGVTLNIDGSRQAFGDEDIKLSMPNEAVGFNGTLSAEVVKLGYASGPPADNNWFVIKVVKVIRFSAKNRTKVNAKALTAAWKDKYVALRGVKGMPKLEVGDMVTVTAAQFEVHLRSTRVSKQVKAKPSGDKVAPDPSPATQPPSTPAAEPAGTSQ